MPSLGTRLAIAFIVHALSQITSLAWDNEIKEAREEKDYPWKRIPGSIWELNSISSELL